MIELTKNTDYKNFLSLLIQQYKDKPNFKGILESIGDEFNEVEDAIFEVRDEFWIDTAVGSQLDVIGQIVGEDRLGRTDVEYRQAIKNKIVINNGSGEPETILFAVTNVYGATNANITFIGIATVSLWVDILLTQADYNDLLKILPAGVNLELYSGSDNPFVFFNDPDGTGFGKLYENQLFDANEDSVLDANGDNIFVLANSSDPDFGGEFQGIWVL